MKFKEHRNREELTESYGSNYGRSVKISDLGRVQPKAGDKAVDDDGVPIEGSVSLGGGSVAIEAGKMVRLINLTTKAEVMIDKKMFRHLKKIT